MVLYSEFTCKSQFTEEKKGLEIRFMVPEILDKYKRSIFLGRPVEKFGLINRDREYYRVAYASLG